MVDTKDIEKPPVDLAEYGYFQLPNGIGVMLVSDRLTDKAAASMDVRVGSMADPEDTPGLAHFLEHMLFYSSEKYPTEDEYSKFLSDHGGKCNAYTAAEETNYHFEVNHDSLEAALDRFAQFFLCPLISADGVEREVNAVDSEHAKNLNSDIHKRSQLLKHTANPEHPYSHFSTGTLATLLTEPRARGLDPAELVRGFYDRQYSAGLMKLAVYGRETLEELEELVRSKFGNVRNTGATVPEYSEDAVTAAEMGKVIRLLPERDGHTLRLQWSIPAEIRRYQAAPCNYLGHLLGHEGQGSLFAKLKASGWATELSAGEGSGSYSSRSFFSISINLTDEGQSHVAEVLEVVFAYIRLLQRPAGITLDRWEEIRDLARLRFNYSDKMSPESAVINIAGGLQVYAPEHVLLASHHVPLHYDEAAIRSVLDELLPERARLLWSSSDFADELDEVEPWYQTPFSRRDLPPDWLARWASAEAGSDLHLPQPNPFVPHDFELVQDSNLAPAVPQVVQETDILRVWHKADTSFSVPKAVVYISFISPEAYVTPEAAVLTSLFCLLLMDYLNEVTYEAVLTGLSFSIGNTAQGFLLTVRGYSHKLDTLLNAIMDHIVKFEVREDRFMVVREKLRKQYANTRYDQPYQQALYNVSVLLELNRWHVNEYAAVVDHLQPADLEAMYGRLMRRLFLEAYVTGNYSSQGALDLVRGVVSRLQETFAPRRLFPSQRPENRVICLPTGRPVLLDEAGTNPANDNSALCALFQVGSDDVARNAVADLLVACAKRDAFYQLRTVEQLGYITWFLGWSVHGVRYLGAVIQSAAFSARHCDRRLESFLDSFGSTIAEMDSDTFAAHVEELAKSKLEKPTRLRQAAARDWGEIALGTLRFDRPHAEVAELRRLSLTDLTMFFQDYVKGLNKRSKLSIHVRGAAEAARPTETCSAEPASAQLPTAASEHGAPTAGQAIINGKIGKAQLMNGMSTAEESNGDASTNGSGTAGQGMPEVDGDVVNDGDVAGEGADVAGQAMSTVSVKSPTGQAVNADGLGLLDSCTGAGEEAPGVLLVENMWDFKRRQAVFPSTR